MAGTEQLRWENMSADERATYLKTVVPDCSFLVGNLHDDTRLIKSYKAILSSVSPVFDRMFNGDFVESREPEFIKITNAEPDDFQCFLDRITYGQREFMICKFDGPEIAFNLFCLSRKYAVKRMEEQYRDNLLRGDHHSYSCYILMNSYAFAVQIDDKELVARFLTLIGWKAAQKPGWSPNICDLDETAFFEWFHCISWHYTSIQLFDFVETYAKCNRLERNPFEEGIMEKMLNLIDFGKMDPHEFQDGPACSNILTGAEKKMFFKNYNANYPAEYEEMEIINFGQIMH